MKALCLIRHAKSSWDDPTLADFDRPLNGRGKRNAPLMGKTLAERGYRPELIVSSPAARAFTTAATIAAELGYDSDQIVTDHLIYEAGVRTLLDVIHGLDDRFESVALVGHNPGFTYLANHVTGGSIDNIPTCGVVQIEFDLSRWRDVAAGSGRQIEYLYPRMFDS